MSSVSISLPPLHTLDPLHRFSNRATDYARCRPSYPQAAIACLFEGLGEPGKLAIADIGAGTGISARLMADWGAKVWAIEPNEAMRSVAEPHPGVNFEAGTAEQTGLMNQSVNLVTAFQAFHWFEPVATLNEFHRILQPAGRVAIIWNDRDLHDPLTWDYTQVIRRASDQHLFDRKDRKCADALYHHPHFCNVREHQFVYYQPLTLPELIGLVLSSSYIPRSGPACDQLLVDLQELFTQWTAKTGSAHFTLAYHTNVYLADRVR